MSCSQDIQPIIALKLGSSEACSQVKKHYPQFTDFFLVKIPAFQSFSRTFSGSKNSLGLAKFKDFCLEIGIFWEKGRNFTVWAGG